MFWLFLGLLKLIFNTICALFDLFIDTLYFIEKMSYKIALKFGWVTRVEIITVRDDYIRNYARIRRDEFEKEMYKLPKDRKPENRHYPRARNVKDTYTRSKWVTHYRMYAEEK